MNKKLNTKSEIVTLRLTPADYRKVKERAEHNGENISEYIRSCAVLRNKRKDAIYTRDSKTIVRNMQTSFNMIHQNIDVDNQKNNILQEAEKLCCILR